jgi:hypothetical protein
MFVTLKTDWPFRNGANKAKQEMVNKGPGRYELEQVPNPLISDGKPWFVFKGTLIGAACGWWFSWVGSCWDEMEMVFEL